jgi:hypothetical protein
VGNEDKYRASVYYDGIGPLPMTQWTESGYMMVWSNYPFSHRNFQDTIPQAVAPLSWSGEIPFLNGIEGYEDLWPDKFMQMRRRNQLGRNGKLHHCLYGDVYGHFEQFTPRYSTQTANGCMVDFVFVQVTDPQAKTFETTQWNRIASAKTAAALVDAGLAVLGKVPGPLDDFAKPSAGLLKVLTKNSVFDAVSKLEAFIQEGKQSVADVQAQLQYVQDQVNEIISLPEMLLSANSDMLDMLYKTQADLITGSKQNLEGQAQSITFEVDRTMTAVELSHRLYEDPDRADEIWQFNPTEGPEWKKGQLLRVLDL